jgi:hypothetical protein
MRAWSLMKRIEIKSQYSAKPAFQRLARVEGHGSGMHVILVRAKVVDHLSPNTDAGLLQICNMIRLFCTLLTPYLTKSCNQNIPRELELE